MLIHRLSLNLCTQSKSLIMYYVPCGLALHTHVDPVKAAKLYTLWHLMDTLPLKVRRVSPNHGTEKCLHELLIWQTIFFQDVCFNRSILQVAVTLIH